MTTIISVENLSKSYRLGQITGRTLTQDLNRWWARVRHQPDPYLKIGQADLSHRAGEEIWALKDVSFTVQQGEVLGIIGRNGAGKSTLLKILSRVTAPTSGVVKVKGRIASLLEVGTGFHPELTGRENIYLNGAILGMTTEEVRRKFNEIVDFAEIEQFIDTPVKRYSSGMYVRLAFAVAAHLEPEILVVDEVLAVGDAAFQQKCLGKMGEVAEGGRTVLFVSHNMASILRLCDTAILLENGNLRKEGAATEVTNIYLGTGSQSPAERNWERIGNAPGDDVAKLRSIKITSLDGKIIDKVSIDEGFLVLVEYQNFTRELYPTVILHFYNENRTCLFATNDWNDKTWRSTPRSPGIVTSVCMIPANFLAEGTISLLVAIGTYNPDHQHALVRDAVTFQVYDRTTSDGVRGVYSGARWPGVIRPLLPWNVSFKQFDE